MPKFGLDDIGGGVKVLKIEAPPTSSQDTPIETATKTLGLVDLMNKLQQAPLEQKIKEADAKLKEHAVQLAPLEQTIKQSEAAIKANTVQQIPIDNVLKRLQLESARNDEHRKQTEFQMKQVQELPTMIGLNPELGKKAVQDIFGPKADAVSNPDGTFVVKIQSKDGIVKAFGIDPNGVASPEKRLTYEDKMRSDWMAQTKSFETVSVAYRNVKDQLGKGTRQGEVAGLYALAKMYDPTTGVREGERADLVTARSWPDWVRDQYNRAVGSENPTMGPVGSPTRQKWIATADSIYKNHFEDAKLNAKNWEGVARAGKLRTESVVTPVGGVDFLAELGAKKEAAPPPPAYEPSSGIVGKVRNSTAPGISPKPTEAGYGGNQSPAPAAPPALSPADALRKHNELRNNWFKSLQTKGNR